MIAAKFSEDIHPVTDLKSKGSTIVNQLSRSRRPVLLTRRGRGVAVLLNLADYEQLVERAMFIDAVQAGAAAAESGDLHDHRHAEAILATFGRDDD